MVAGGVILAAVVVFLATVLTVPFAYEMWLSWKNPYRFIRTGRKVPLLHRHCAVPPLGDIGATAKDPLGHAEEAEGVLDELGIDCGVTSLLLTHQELWVFGKANIKTLMSSSVTLKKSRRDIGRALPHWDMMFGQGLFMTSGDTWRRIHKIALKAMGSGNKSSFSPFADATAATLVGVLEELTPAPEHQNQHSDLRRQSSVLCNTLGAVEAARKFDMMLDIVKEGVKPLPPGKIEMDLALFCDTMSLHTICSVAFGHEVDFKLCRENMNCFINYNGGAPPLPGQLSLPLESSRKLKAAVKVLHEYCHDLVREARTAHADATTTTDTARPNLLQQLVAASDGDEVEGKLSESEVVHNVMGFMGAGISTTSDSLRHILIQLALHPDVQTKLRNELRQVVGTDTTTVSHEQLEGIGYLTAVIVESLRLFPSVTGLPARIATEDFEVAGVRIRKGQIVNTSSLIGQRRKSVFGADAHQFNPDRFVDRFNGSKTGMVDTLDYTLTSFGGGIRPCIGKHLSLTETRILVCHLLLRFEIFPTLDAAGYRAAVQCKVPFLTIREGTTVGLRKMV